MGQSMRILHHPSLSRVVPNRPISFRAIPARWFSCSLPFVIISPKAHHRRNEVEIAQTSQLSLLHLSYDDDTMSSQTLEYASNAPEPVPNAHPPNGSAHDESESRYPRLAPHLLLPDGTPDYLRLILNSKVYDLVKETPLVRAVNLSAKLGNEIWLKREDLQEVFSFKIRGAYNFMAHLSEEERWRGVVTCSAGSYVCPVKNYLLDSIPDLCSTGPPQLSKSIDIHGTDIGITGNHAQGVALSGARLKIPCTIVMPRGTPSIKVRNVQRLGATVVLHGDDFDAAKLECARLAHSHGVVFVPPYDDPLVIAGQGTVGAEILRQIPESDTLDAVFTAVGGGGLAAGVGEYIKRIGNPGTRVFGVETVDGDAMARSLVAGERVTLSEVGPFSDGTAVKIVGEEPFRVCQKRLDGVVKVDNDAICAAIKDIFEGAFAPPTSPTHSHFKRLTKGCRHSVYH